MEKNPIQIVSILFICLIATLMPSVVYAQDQIVIDVYHGIQGSRIVDYQSDNGIVKSEKTIQSFQAKKGTKILIRISNANPYFYTYSVSSVDRPNEKLPDLSALTSLLSSQITKSENASPPWWDDYRSKLQTVEKGLSIAQDIIKNSDVPEAISELDGNPEHGFKYAQGQLLKIGTPQNGQIGDPTIFRLFDGSLDLKSSLDSWYNAAKVAADAAVGDKDANKFILSVFQKYAGAMLGTKNSINSMFLHPAEVKFETTVGDNPVTLHLKIKARDTTTTLVRELGDSVVTLNVNPFYDRATVVLAPVAYSIIASNVPSFSIVNGKITRGEDVSARFRAGGFLSITPWNIGSYDQVGIGLGLGFGISTSGSTKFFSDFLFGGTISYRDDIRIGIGYGVAQLPSGLKAPFVEGQSLPTNSSSLDDIIENDYKGAIFILFNITGLNLKLP